MEDKCPDWFDDVNTMRRTYKNPDSLPLSLVNLIGSPEFQACAKARASRAADAAQSYHDFGLLVMRAGGDVVLFIKDNTLTTRADLELFFEDEQADRGTWQFFAQIEKSHLRMLRRHITVSPGRNRVSAPGLG